MSGSMINSYVFVSLDNVYILCRGSQRKLLRISKADMFRKDYGKVSVVDKWADANVKYKETHGKPLHPDEWFENHRKQLEVYNYLGRVSRQHTHTSHKKVVELFEEHYSPPWWEEY